MEYQVLDLESAEYPARLRDRLGEKAPPRLWVHGPLTLLDRFTMAVACSDSISGLGLNATNQLLFTIRELDLNYIGGWHSVMETEIFRLGLYRANSSVTLLSAKGLAVETHESWLRDRFYPPLDDFPERDEYFRRAEAGELLLLSAVEPTTSRATKPNIYSRNLYACALADVTFFPYGPKGSKTYRLASEVKAAGWPTFTIEHELARDLHELGIPGYSRSTVGEFLAGLGAKVALPMARPVTTHAPKELPERPRTKPTPPRHTQQDLPFVRDARAESDPSEG
ncbi:hypothetical protein JXD38_05765 [candidate division WOR-3 bacterium]|nr:hypothetical protein [candidate division WOR-3 bacterium]